MVQKVKVGDGPKGTQLTRQGESTSNNQFVCFCTFISELKALPRQDLAAEKGGFHIDILTRRHIEETCVIMPARQRSFQEQLGNHLPWHQAMITLPYLKLSISFFNVCFDGAPTSAVHSSNRTCSQHQQELQIFL